MKIILDGTSSSGKTSISNEFPKKYKHISMDDILHLKPFDVFKNVKNKYHSEKKIDNVFMKHIFNKMKLQAKNQDNFTIDIVHYMSGKPDVYEYLPKETKKILVYSNFAQLVSNMNKRKNYDPRGKFVFEQFPKYYVKTNNANKMIDTVNLDAFIKNLEQIKYEFENKKQLISFAKEIFKNMDIHDNKNHFIKPRYNDYDLILNTNNKTPKELRYEIESINMKK